MTTTHDSWVNPVTGVGGDSDKSANFTFVGGDEWCWDWTRLADLYEADAIAAKIVNAVVDESFMADWTLEVGADSDAAQASRDWFDAIGGTKAIKQARKWSRLYGGGAVYIGSDDGSQTDPLTIGKGRIHFLTAYEASELIPSRYYSNPLMPNYGAPSHYQLMPMTRASVRPIVHESRLILFDGVDTTKIKREQRQGWGGSVLIRPMKAIQQFNATFATVQALLADSSQNVYKWKGLGDMLMAGQNDLIEARMKVFDQVRSAIKAIVVDADSEDFVRSQLQLGGIEGIMDKFMLRVSGAADMPASKLFGEAAAGLNATGEGDARNWHAQVAVEQREQLEPAMDRALRVMFNAPNGPTGGTEPDSWEVSWPPLWAPTPSEEADIATKNAATDQTYFDMGALTAQQIAKARFTAGGGERVVLTDAEIEAISPAMVEVPTDGEELAVETEAPTQTNALEITPSDLAKIVTVNEARRASGLSLLVTPEGEPDPDGGLTIEEFAAKRATAAEITGEQAGTVQAVGAVATVLPPAPGGQPVNPVDTADTDQGTDASVEALAAKMTEFAVQRCEHGVVNRCVKCGIERTRDFAIGNDGQPVRDAEGNIQWSVLWRPIGAKAPAVGPAQGQAETPT
jgi:phage-related protein (TIGR01555 family)